MGNEFLGIELTVSFVAVLLSLAGCALSIGSFIYKHSTTRLWNLNGIESVAYGTSFTLIPNTAYVFVNAPLARAGSVFKSLRYCYEIADHPTDFKYVEGSAQQIYDVSAMVIIIVDPNEETKIIRDLPFLATKELIEKIKQNL